MEDNTSSKSLQNRLMSSKACDLCGKPARMFCDSDQASLCWDCDEKVHAANFLVAKHCRTLLCHVCTSHTPWKAAGLSLGPAVSLCRTCAEDEVRRGDERNDPLGNQNFESQESENDDGEYYNGSDSNSDDDEDGENQVVPWSICSLDPPPPLAASSSCSGDVASSASLKRMRDSPFESENDLWQNPGMDLNVVKRDSSSTSSFRPLKARRANNYYTEQTPSELVAAGQNQANSPSLSGAAAVVDALRRFQQETETEGKDVSPTILGITITEF